MIYSLQNPSILAQVIAIVFAGFLWLFVNNKAKLFKYISSVFVLFLLGAIINLNSRIAILSAIAAVIYIAYPHVHFANKKIFLFGSLSFFLLSIALLFLLMKQDSSSGRLFIWQRSLELWEQNWLTGTGYGGFNPAYNHIQAAYFSTHSLTSKEAMLANDGYFAFNEWLHIAVEFGIIGLILSLVITWCVLKACYKNVATKRSWAGAMLIPVLTGNLFSYPLHNTFILGISVFLSLYIIFGSYRFSTRYNKWVKTFAVLILISIIVFYSFRHFMAQQSFKIIKQTVREGYKNDAVALCQNASQALKSDYSFQLFYLNLLYQTNRLGEAETFFSKFHRCHCNQKAHSVIAKCYEELGDSTKAEEHYLLSLYIVPQLLQSRVDLMDFYNKMGNIEKAKYWAQQTINCPIKVMNPLALYLKQQAGNYIDAH